MTTESLVLQLYLQYINLSYNPINAGTAQYLLKNNAITVSDHSRTPPLFYGALFPDKPNKSIISVRFKGNAPLKCSKKKTQCFLYFYINQLNLVIWPILNLVAKNFFIFQYKAGIVNSANFTSHI